MKKITLLFLVLLLAGCAPKKPLTAHLSFEPLGPTDLVYDGRATATLRSVDSRTDPEIIRYKTGNNEAIRIPNDGAVHQAVADRLVAGLKAQGLRFVAGAPVHLRLEINNLVAAVSKQKLLYIAEATSNISISVKNKNKTFTKTYERESELKSMTRPDVDKLEKLLSDQIGEIVTQILEDQQLQKLILQSRP